MINNDPILKNLSPIIPREPYIHPKPIKKEDDKGDVDNTTKIDFHGQLPPICQDILNLLFLLHFITVTELPKRLGLSKHSVNKAVETLVRMGLVVIEGFRMSRRGSIWKYLIPTDYAYRLMNRTQKKRKGRAGRGVRHWFLQEFLWFYIKSWGVKVVQEFSLQGKLADLAVKLVNSDNWIAIEIVQTTAKIEYQNVIKNIEAGFSKTIILCEELKAIKEVEAGLRKHLDFETLVNVKICLLADLIEYKDLSKIIDSKNLVFTGK